MTIPAVGSVPTAAHSGLTDMMPVYIFLNGYGDVIPTVDALVDCGYQLYDSRQGIKNATSIIMMMGWNPQILIDVWYK